MSFADNVTKPDVQKAACLEIKLDGGTKYYADTDLPETSTDWDNRIISMSELTRALDPRNLQFAIADVTIILKNDADDASGVGHFDSLLQSETFDNREANVYLKYKESDGTIVSQKVYAGICYPGKLSPDGTRFTLKIRSNLRSKLGTLQRSINDLAFTSAPDGTTAAYPESTLGWGMNVVAGHAASGRGAVRLLMVDETANAEKFLIAQHEIFNAPKVFRKRDNVFTQRTLTTHYTVTKLAKDGESKPYSYVQLASGEWEEGDEYYADVQGLTRTFADLDSSSDYYSKADHADFAYTTALAIGFRVRFDALPSAGTKRYLISQYAGGQRAHQLYVDGDDNSLVFSISGDGSTSDTVALGTVTTGKWYDVLVSFDGDNGKIYTWLDDTRTETDTAITSLHNSTADLCIGADSSGAWRLNCDIDYAYIGGVVISDGRHPARADLTSWWEFMGDGNDFLGNHNLTENGSPVYTNSLEKTPSDAALMLLTRDYGWNFPHHDIDYSAFAAAATECQDRNYNTTNYFGFIIPESQHTIEKQEGQWSLLSEFCRNFGHAVVITGGGQIAPKFIDTTTTTSATVPIYREKDGAIEMPGITEDVRLVELFNDAQVRYRHSHHDFEANIHGFNDLSKKTFKLTKVAHWNFRGIRNSAMVKDVANRELMLYSGKTKRLKFGVRPGGLLFQANSNIADIIKIKPASRPSGSGIRQGIIISHAPEIVTYRGRLEVATIGDQVGATAWREQAQATLFTSINTFVGATENACSGNDDGVDSDANASYGTLNYLRHGHHGHADTVCSCDGLAWGNINWRALFRFDLSSWSGRTIVSVSIRLHILATDNLLVNYGLIPDCTYPQYLANNWSGSDIHKCTDTNWTTSSSWNGESWSDSKISTSHGSLGGGAGTKYAELDSNGIQYFQDAVDGNADPGGTGNEVNLILDAFSDGTYAKHAKIASARHGTINYRPAAIITYIT